MKLDSGRSTVAGLVKDHVLYIALGTGSTAVTKSDTTLVAETTAAGLARALGTGSRITIHDTNDTAKVTKTFTNTSGNPVSITEYGWFDAAAAGNMIERRVAPAIVVANGESLVVTFLGNVK